MVYLVISLLVWLLISIVGIIGFFKLAVSIGVGEFIGLVIIFWAFAVVEVFTITDVVFCATGLLLALLQLL